MHPVIPVLGLFFSLVIAYFVFKRDKINAWTPILKCITFVDFIATVILCVRTEREEIVFGGTAIAFIILAFNMVYLGIAENIHHTRICTERMLKTQMMMLDELKRVGANAPQSQVDALQPIVDASKECSPLYTKVFGS